MIEAYRQARKPTIRRFVVFLALVVGALLIALYYAMVTYDPGADYLRYEMPLVEAEVTKVPGLSIARVENVGPHDEKNIYVTFVISGKGTLTLKNPTHESFTGGGYIYIREIDGCRTSLPSPPSAPWRFNTVAEVIEKYDAINERLQEEQLCH